MKEFLSIYGFLQNITLLWWLYTMLISKPKFNNGNNRFMKNYNEGGKYTLFMFSFLAMMLSVVVLIILSILKVFDKLF